MKQYLLLTLCLVAFNLNILGKTSLKNNYASLFEGKNILVTGGTGTLGSAVVKALLRFNPNKIIIFSRDEAKHFRFLESLRNNPKLQSYIGDVRDYNALLKATKNVDIVIHTAALKRVDTIESSVEEAIKTNILGSSNIFDACVHNNVKYVVNVSTDKSCSPVSAYGASKFIGEKIFSNYDYENTPTIFTTVRFGNIVGSNGSIVPIFLEKIKNGENIPLTDVRMTRFMITKEQAAEVIFDAIKYGRGGEIFVKQVTSIKILDFIEVLINKLNSSSKIFTMGLRPGERTYESLITDVEIDRTYEYNGNYIITPSRSEWKINLKKDFPDYLTLGIPLNKKISKELSSHDYVISKEELVKWFDQFNIISESHKSLINKEEIYEDTLFI
jgi:FlaA1/EpsC-like NDP-sugar epimerase